MIFPQFLPCAHYYSRLAVVDCHCRACAPNYRVGNRGVEDPEFESLAVQKEQFCHLVF